MKTTPDTTNNRSQEITERYFTFIQKHVEDIVNGNANEFLELNEIAKELAISHTHLTDTVKKITGNHPCFYYDEKIIEEAKKLLLTTDKSIAEIAHILTYEASNFSNFFKKWVKVTPAKFRKNTLNS